LRKRRNLGANNRFMEIFIKPVLWTYRRITKGKKNLVEGEYEIFF
jgi:hypothetical protein